MLIAIASVGWALSLVLATLWRHGSDQRELERRLTVEARRSADYWHVAYTQMRAIATRELGAAAPAAAAPVSPLSPVDAEWATGVAERFDRWEFHCPACGQFLRADRKAAAAPSAPAMQAPPAPPRWHRYAGASHSIFSPADPSAQPPAPHAATEEIAALLGRSTTDSREGAPGDAESYAAPAPSPSGEPVGAARGQSEEG